MAHTCSDLINRARSASGASCERSEHCLSAKRESCCQLRATLSAKRASEASLFEREARVGGDEMAEMAFF